MTPTPIQGGFWEVNFGNVLTVFLLLLSFWGAHISNVRRVQSNAAELQELKTKLELIYQWFCNNVVGRGEPLRRHGAGVPMPGASGAQSGDD